MSHLSEGTLVAVRDGGATDGETRVHLDGCDVCRGGLEDARSRAEVVSALLATLDGPVDYEDAKATVRARLDRLGPARAPRTPWAFGRAAALLLLAAGAASALPGSPLRSWWTAPPPTPATDQVQEVATPPTAPVGGIAVQIPDGRIVVDVRGAAPGAEVELEWVDGASARVTASAGSSFSYADGLARVEAAPGAIRVELPRNATEARLVVDGVTYADRSTGGVAVSGPEARIFGDVVRFRVPGR